MELLAKKYWFKLLGAIFFVGLFSVISPRVHAAPQDITITPTSVNIVIQPGSVNKGSFKVINQGSTEYSYQIYAAPYRVSGEDYTPEFTILPNAPNVADWFRFSTSGSHSSPGQTDVVNYTITVPEGTLAGGYYAVAFAETQFPKTANGVTLNERVGELFYMQVAGTVVQKGSLLTWQSNFFQKPPLTSYLRLENAGAVHYTSTLKVTVSDILGNPKYTLATQKIILPQTIRKITIPWNQTPSIGLFKVNGVVSFLDQTHNLPTSYVFVMSQTVRMYTVIALIVIILLAILRFIYRHFRQRKNAKKASK